MPISGRNAKRVLWGAINIETGYRLFRSTQQGRGVDFEAFLDEIRWAYPSRYVVVLLDEDSSHMAETSSATAYDLDIELLPLPKRSPKLNPMDHLWWHGKDVISANYQYGFLDTQVEWFIGYLSSLSPYEALSKAGLLSKDSWLKL